MYQYQTRELRCDWLYDKGYRQHIGSRREESSV